jgi:hypothetical protein
MTPSIYKVRASSWGELFDCGYKWEAKHLLGMTMPSGPRALLGTSIHAGTAAFDSARMNGSPISAYEAGDYMVKALREPEYEVDWSSDDSITLQSAQDVGLQLLTMYCNVWAPQYEFAAVEMETKPLTIDCGGNIHVVLTGTLDRSRIFKKSGKKGIADVKTGSSAVEKGAAKTKGYRPQLGTYELLYEHSTGESISADAEIIGMKTKGNIQIANGFIKNAKQMMIGTNEHPGLIEIAAEMFKTGLFPPNPTSNLCNKKYCVRWNSCPYRD